MKRLILFLALVCLLPMPTQSQGMATVPLGEVVHIEDLNLFDSMGNLQNADSTVACAVYEEATDTAIVSFNLTQRTALTGEYRGTFTASTANGFEIGKWYNTKCRPTVDALTQTVNKGHFRVIAVEGYIYPRAVAVTAFMFKMRTSSNADCLGKATVITRTRSIDGAAFAVGTLGAVGSGVTEVGVGWYSIPVPAADIDGEEVVFRFTATANVCQATEYKIRTNHN